MFKKFVLKNNLRLITVNFPNTQAVTILILVGSGSKYEKKETNGISHFLEHMFFKGTKKRKTSFEIAQVLDKVGGIYNAFTSYDYTGYFAKVESSQFDLALDWVADIFLNSQLPPKEIEKEKGVITEEINMLYDNPLTHISLLWQELLYGDQPAGWPIVGKKEIIKKITRTQLINYKNTHYIASNTIICIVGKIKEKDVFKKIERYFLKTKKGVLPQKEKIKEFQRKPRTLFFFKNTDQTHLCLGVRAFGLFHPQRYAIEILGNILGGMMSSRLFVKIREKLGIAYYIHTDIHLDPDTGFLVTEAGVDNSKVKIAISSILEEYKNITKNISEQEIKKAKENIKGKMALYLESSDALAFFYAGQELLEKRILTPQEIFEKIDKVKKKDIIKVAKEIFVPEKLNLALLGPKQNKTEIESILKL